MFTSCTNTAWACRGFAIGLNGDSVFKFSIISLVGSNLNTVPCKLTTYLIFIRCTCDMCSDDCFPELGITIVNSLPHMCCKVYNLYMYRVLPRYTCACSHYKIIYYYYKVSSCIVHYHGIVHDTCMQPAMSKLDCVCADSH